MSCPVEDDISLHKIMLTCMLTIVNRQLFVDIPQAQSPRQADEMGIEENSLFADRG